MGLGEQIQIPCNVGDKFWVIAYSKEPRIVQVECTGFTVLVDKKTKTNERYIWLDSVENDRDYWKMPFEYVEDQCFKTKGNAEMMLSLNKHAPL